MIVNLCLENPENSFGNWYAEILYIPILAVTHSLISDFIKTNEWYAKEVWKDRMGKCPNYNIYSNSSSLSDSLQPCYKLSAKWD